jgi:hypothetical protein
VSSRKPAAGEAIAQECVSRAVSLLWAGASPLGAVLAMVSERSSLVARRIMFQERRLTYTANIF